MKIGDQVWMAFPEYYYEWEKVGALLKADSGWKADGEGKDSFGFNGLPAGCYDDYNFDDLKVQSYWWTATEANDPQDPKSE